MSTLKTLDKIIKRDMDVEIGTACYGSTIKASSIFVFL